MNLQIKAFHHVFGWSKLERNPGSCADDCHNSKGPDAFTKAQMELFTLNQIQDYVVRDLKSILDTSTVK